MLQGLADAHFKDYDMDTDRELFVNMLTKYRDDIDPRALARPVPRGSRQVQGRLRRLRRQDVQQVSLAQRRSVRGLLGQPQAKDV